MNSLDSTPKTCADGPCQSEEVNPLDIVRTCDDRPCQGEGLNPLDMEEERTYV